MIVIPVSRAGSPISEEGRNKGFWGALFGEGYWGESDRHVNNALKAIALGTGMIFASGLLGALAGDVTVGGIVLSAGGGVLIASGAAVVGVESASKVRRILKTLDDKDEDRKNQP